MTSSPARRAATTPLGRVPAPRRRAIGDDLLTRYDVHAGIEPLAAEHGVRPADARLLLREAAHRHVAALEAAGVVLPAERPHHAVAFPPPLAGAGPLSDYVLDERL